MASILGKTDDEQKYRSVAKEVKRVFNKYFIREDGSIKEGRQRMSGRWHLGWLMKAISRRWLSNWHSWSGKTAIN